MSFEYIMADFRSFDIYKQYNSFKLQHSFYFFNWYYVIQIEVNQYKMSYHCNQHSKIDFLIF